MGSIVGAFGTAHLVMKRGTAGEAGERVFDGMKEIGRRVRALSPDRLVIISSDHFYNYRIGTPIAYGVAAADSHRPFGDMHLPTDPFAGDALFARGLAAHSGAASFDLAVLEDYRPDHGVVIPMLMVGRAAGVPVIPVITNTANEPAPSLADGWRLGGLIREYVEQRRRAEERVVVIGTGGLSHWLAVPEMGRVNSEFDLAVIDALTQGRGESLLGWTGEQILAEGGNGGLEIVNWLMMAGTMPGATGERVYYEPIPEWVTGMGGIELFANTGNTK
ncbi:MAG TPA: hypothetical protein PKD99_05480 [Sphingopyxis sp.]|nr:hypothetical protein [Sphingopyxis sp.]HMP44538.1 hypothetical protein [Sphingopyxis sp.]